MKISKFNLSVYLLTVAVWLLENYLFAKYIESRKELFMGSGRKLPAATEFVIELHESESIRWISIVAILLLFGLAMKIKEQTYAVICLGFLVLWSAFAAAGALILEAGIWK